MKKTAAQNAVSRARAKGKKGQPLPPTSTAIVDEAAVWLHPDDLHEWPDNPRVVDAAAVTRVAKSIQRYGFGAPIVVRRANFEIIAGHGRWRAAQQLLLERVPVRLLDVTDAQAHELAIIDNRYSELTKWSGSLGDVLSRYPIDEVAFLGWTQEQFDKVAAHLIASGTSGEVDLDKLAAETFAHKCPQCGCEFNV